VRLGLDGNASIDEVQAAVARLDSVDTTETDRNRATIIAIAKSGNDGTRTWRDVSDLAADKGWNLESMQLESGRLDEVFRHITQGAES